jgi:energy-coupling factor transport system ATP-binding protein
VKALVSDCISSGSPTCIGLPHLALNDRRRTALLYRLNDGQRRRILIARALLTRPDVLLDEPTAGLQPADRHEMLGELCRLATEYTLVLATQDPLVTALADYLVRLEPCRAARS